MDLQRLRLLPLNQLALLRLREAGAVDDGETLPVFQLMSWGLANGVHPTHRRTGRELLRLRYLSDQEVALTYLLQGIPGGLPALQRRLLHLPARAAAEELLETLDQRLKADPRNPYPE